MAQRLSRRTLALYAADQLMSGTDRDKLIDQLAGYLVESRRAKEADLLVRDIESELSNRGHVVARVSSAHSLSAEQTAEIVRQLKSSQDAQAVELQQDIDVSLIGGVRIELPGYEYDGTLRRRLNALKSQIEQ